MSELDWSTQGLEDSYLLKKIYDVRNDVQYKKLDLSYNKLTSIPNLRMFRKFANLEVLVLWYNNIRHIDFSLIPPTVTKLGLSHNKLTSVGNLTHCRELKYLDVGSNHITHVDWKNLPPALTQLGLYNNKITAVDLIHFAQVESLNLENNHRLLSIQSLPNKDFKFFTDSSVKVLERRCFHEKTYNMLKEKCIILKWQLDESPVEVLLQGLEAVLEFYKEFTIRTTHTR